METINYVHLIVTAWVATLALIALVSAVNLALTASSAHERTGSIRALIAFVIFGMATLVLLII